MATFARDAKFSLPSILALIFAVLAFFDTGIGFLLAIAAIICGLVGAFVAISPAKRGGILSIFAILAGILAALVSIIGFAFGVIT